ncbi:MAG: hypothetical protein JXR78_16660 [Victivallales bacterium]|nr:hypothetical protein [Victivallales bacterium]
MNTSTNNTYFSYRSFWPEFEAMKQFREKDVNTICFFASNTNNSLGEPYCKYPPMWLWYDCYDFNPVDNQINDILSVNPDAELICIIDLNNPEWLLNNQNVHYMYMYSSFNELGRAICEENWRNHISAFLENFLNHVESKYSSKIKSYVLSCGKTSEWMDYSRGVESPGKLKAFQAWCKENSLPVPDDIPPMTERNQADFDNLLRNPQNNANALNYWRFCSHAVVDTISYFIDKTRSIIPEQTEIGVFYGYILELGHQRLVSFGHMDYERLLEHPGLNFLISPGTYHDRAMGGGSGFMVPNGTLKLKNKSFMHECDQATHTANDNLTPFVSIKRTHWLDNNATIAGLKRETALALMNNFSLWWFDMWGGFYNEPSVMSAIGKLKNIWDEYSSPKYDSVAEIAMIVDPQNCCYFNQDNPATDEFSSRIRDKLNRSGAPFDVYSFNDIPEITTLKRYKCFIFCMPFEITGEDKQILKKYILKDQHTIVWLYAPGISDGFSLDEKRVELLCGCAFGSPGINKRNMGDWTSIYIHNPAKLVPSSLKNILSEAGVTIYCKEEIPVYANERLVAVHTAQGGDIEITLPRLCKTITELYSGEIVATDVSKFSCNFESPDTKIFKLEI